MKEQFAIALFVLLSNVHWDLLLLRPLPGPNLQASNSHSRQRSQPESYRLVELHTHHHQQQQQHQGRPHSSRQNQHVGPGAIVLAEAKGVAGLGKAGGEGQGGADKAGQQVPPEVYMALTYAGTLFLFTLSVPLILYGLNKLLNKIEDCFGCGPSARREKAKLEREKQSNGHAFNGGGGGTGVVHKAPASISATLDQTQAQQQQQQQQQVGASVPQGEPTKQAHQNQRLHLQMLQQYAKHTQFISMSTPDYNPAESFASADTQQPQPPLEPAVQVAPGPAYPFSAAPGNSVRPSRQTSPDSVPLNQSASPRLGAQAKI